MPTTPATATLAFEPSACTTASESGLAPRQLDALRLIRWQVGVRGYAPTVRELAAALGVASTNTVAGHLAALERKGFITREPGRARALRLTDAGKGAP